MSTTERAFLNAHGPIKLCTATNSMPLDDIIAGEHQGINAEYMALFSSELEHPITLYSTESWQESLRAIQAGKCDIISLAARTPQREEFLIFSEPYVKISFVIVTTQEKFFVSRLSQLVDKGLAVQQGYAYVDLLKNRYPDINLIQVDSIEEGLELVNKGEIFGYLSGLNLAGYAIQDGGYTNLKINGQFDELSLIELGIGIRKQLPLLQPIFNKAIASIPEQTKKQIDNSWLTVKYNIVEDYQRILQFTFATAIILLFLVYRQMHLKKRNSMLAERERAIWHQANYDFLTGLPNRRLFQDRLAQKISRIERTQNAFALLLIDLDGFKEINDTQGHDQGDKLLVEASVRINNCLRKSDTIARLGGDEFVVLMNDIDRRGCVEIVAQKILDELTQPFHLKESAFVSASMGITLCPKDSSDMVELLKHADQAMYAAKESGKNKFNYFTPELQNSALERVKLVKELRRAINEGEFILHYQPIINLETRSVDKAEALIRWQHPEKGLIPPFHFIPVLEDTGLINEVGEWVYLEAARQVQVIRNQFDPHFQVSVNVSPVQIHNNTTQDWVEQLTKLERSPKSLAIEITENTLMEETGRVNDQLHELKNAGIQVSLDDFGTGFSSLSYLKKFNFDYLKIDRSFVQNLSINSRDSALCEAIIVMSHKLGIKVIAEGVESKEQQSLLARYGCDYLQGYYFSKPIEFSELLLYLANYQHDFTVVQLTS